MMEVNGGSAGIVGTGPGPDDSLAQQRLLKPRIVEVAFHEFHHRPIEQERDCVPVALEPGLDLPARWGFPDPHVTAAFGTQCVPDPLLEAGHGSPAGQVPGREALDLLVGPVVVSPELNAGSILEWDEKPR